MHLRGSKMIATLLAVILPFTCGGCLTPKVWQWADQTSLGFKGGQGIVGDAKTGRALVLLYANDSESRYFYVPLQADGRPIPPFDGGDIHYDHDGAYVVISSSQATAVARATLLRWAGSPNAPRNVSTREQSVLIHGDLSGAAAIGYQINPDKTLSWILMSQSCATTRNATAPAPPVDRRDTVVLLVPQDISLPTDEKRSRKIVATLATPATVSGDIVIGIVMAPVLIAFTGYILFYIVSTKPGHRSLP